jgi:hypothetical protein
MMSDTENYEELAERLTGEAPVKGKGEALRGEEAAASGQQLLTTALGLEHLPKEDVTKLFNNSEFVKWVCYPDSQLPEELRELLSDQPSTLLYGGGGSGKTVAPAISSQDTNEE